MNQLESMQLLKLLKARAKIKRTGCDWFCFSLVEKLAQYS